MPYTIKWYIENEIAFVHYSGAISAEDLRAALLATKGFIESSPRNLVHVINDVGDVTIPLMLKDSLGVVRQVGSHERAGWTLTIHEKSLVVKMSAALGASLFKMRYRTFETLEQAVAHLKSVDETIEWDKADGEVVKDIV